MKSKLNLTVAAVVFILAAYALAGPIKVWSNGERLTAADLNSNFADIHNSMVGGHGPRLVDADVSGSANISYSKIQNGANIPRAWAFARDCDGGACTVVGPSSGDRISSIGNSASGEYPVTLNYTPADTRFGVTVGAGPQGGSYSISLMPVCTVDTLSTSAPHFYVHCVNVGRSNGAHDGGTLTMQADFTLAVFDNN